MSDIVDRLRAFVELDGGDLSDVEAAANEIERLQAEVEALRAAIADVHAAYAHSQQQFVDARKEVEALRPNASLSGGRRPSA